MSENITIIFKFIKITNASQNIFFTTNFMDQTDKRKMHSSTSTSLLLLSHVGIPILKKYNMLKW